MAQSTPVSRWWWRRRCPGLVERPLEARVKGTHVVKTAWRHEDGGEVVMHATRGNTIRMERRLNTYCI